MFDIISSLAIFKTSAGIIRRSQSEIATGIDVMPYDTSYIQSLNDDLKIFFKNAVRITLRRPSQALQFFRVVRWQQKALRKRKLRAKEGIHVPPIIIFSITHRCNLNCKGCYAKALKRTARDELSDAELERIIGEAHALGTSFFVIAGGEPLVRESMMDVAEKYKDMLFLIFTNGLLIDDAMLKRFKKHRNIVPVLSLEGHQTETDDRRGEGIFKRLRQIVKRLQDEKIFFSVSMTVTRLNLPVILDGSFVDNMVSSGCQLFFFLEYTAIHEGTEDWIPTEEERVQLNDAVDRFRQQYSSLFISVPGDEEKFGGCLSAGRGFIHITADGDLEPCPFAPFSDINLKNMPLKEALRSRLLSVIRENADKLEEGQGGCTLWQQREWVESLLDEPVEEKR